MTAAIDGAAFLADPEGHIEAWSAGAQRLLGYSADQVLGRPCHALFDGRDLFGNRYCVPGCPILHACRAGDAPRPHELSLRRADGSYATYVCVATRVRESPAARAHLLYQLFERAAPVEARRPERAPSPRLPAAAKTPLDRLSPRERQVLTQLARGASTQDAATTLRISPTTLRNHVQAILRKLAVGSKLEAVVLAYKHGLAGRDPV
ncbi:MAG: PAS and helix-turn-helix domain-containing protein [Planctomycetes bacterium]|nr:PAS and helix-turn-helix domain-containing protein [Planctomycetota bacterium]